MTAQSPKLTGLMVTVIPAIIGVGTVMGSGLRKLSKQAQSQVSRYNSHPSNYRCRNPNKNCLRMCILVPTHPIV
jgi:hypothetical protein